MDNKRKSLKFGIVGLGTCGGNLAEEFSKKGYNSVIINSSETELNRRHVLDNQKLYIRLSNGRGTKQDVITGKQSLENNAPQIVARVRDILKDSEYLILTAGLGGRLGSNIVTLVSILSGLNLPVSIMVTLPSDFEDRCRKISALNAIANIAKVEINSIIIVDNQKNFYFPEQERFSAMLYDILNSMVIQTTDEINRLFQDHRLILGGNLNNSGLERIFSTNGILIYDSCNLEKMDFYSPEGLADKLMMMRDSGGLFANGFNGAKATISAISLLGHKNILQGTSKAVYKNLFETAAQLTTRGQIYSGIFQIPDTETMKLYMILGGLAFPDRLGILLDQINKAGGDFTSSLNDKSLELDKIPRQEQEIKKICSPNQEKGIKENFEGWEIKREKKESQTEWTEKLKEYFPLEEKEENSKPQTDLVGFQDEYKKYEHERKSPKMDKEEIHNFNREKKYFPARVIAIVGPESDIGKANVVVNLAIGLAKMGKRVLLMDVDSDAGNIKTISGFESKYSFQDVIEGQKNIIDIVIDGPAGIKIISLNSSFYELTSLENKRKNEIISQLEELENDSDVILIHTEAGISPQVVNIIKDAKEVVVVTSPQAAKDAYIIIKTISKEDRKVDIDLVINVAENEKEVEQVTDKIVTMAKKFLSTKVNYLGYLLADNSIFRAIKEKSPFILTCVNSEAAHCMNNIASQLINNQENLHQVSELSGFCGRTLKSFANF